VRSLLLSLVLPLCILVVFCTFSSRNASGSGPARVFISEVGWGGTAASSSDEWIELYNAGEQSVSLQGWRLFDSSGDVDVVLTGTLAGGAFFLLERTAEDTLSNLLANVLYTGGLHNGGEQLTLLDNEDQLVDQANGTGGAWPAGSAAPDYRSMERVAPGENAVVDEWHSYDGPPSTILDADGNPVNGSPGQPNVAWSMEPQPPGGPGSGLVIDALLYDGYEGNDADEALRLYNVSQEVVNLSGWSITDGAVMSTIIPSYELAPGEAAWLAENGEAFRRQFGFDAQLLLQSWPGFANSGDEVQLLNPAAGVVDVLVYKDGDTSVAGWSGPALHPYRSGSLFAEEGQILYRKRDQLSGEPVLDTDRAVDWAQSMDDAINGRKVQYPGWSLEQFFFPELGTSLATVTVSVAPDNAYETLVRQIGAAEERIQLVSHTFENLAIAEALVAAAQRGVEVKVLLEGAPAGGMSDQQRYICALLWAEGGACWFMIRDSAGNQIEDRYRYLHAKYAIIDGRLALVSSENLSANSMPFDDKGDGTWGRRGVLLITDAPPVVARLEAIFADDFAPDDHQDLLQWTPEHPVYGNPSPGYVPATESGGVTYTVRYEAPVAFQGAFDFGVVQSPESSLRSEDGLLGLLAQAGEGDTVLVQQLTERPYWGASTSNPHDDPNPRLEAFIDAARRGAWVQLLLDSFFDDESSATGNAATCAYVNGVATAEHLALQCALGNPAGLGIHNKMVLVEIDGKGWVHVGSLNGTELSSKGNREVALQVQSDAAYAYLASVFEGDWPNQLWLPLLLRERRGPAGYPLISEFLYDPVGPDDAEFIEIANPTFGTLDLSYWTIADAVHPDDFEDVRRFPAGTLILPGRALVVAASATGFQALFGFRPDFELVSSDPLVPDLEDVVEWGDPAALLQLGNEGDELLLRRPDGQVVDVVTYGSGVYGAIEPCDLLLTAGHSLERFPYWLDTDNCEADFRPWPFPSPGQLP
jgi:phosphatidylserine/phosphatidylglycerophosphate/cardiolipin synthase-like enzyme